MRRLLLAVLGVSAIAGSAAVGYLWSQDSLLYVSTNNAQVAGYMTQVGTLEGGRVKSVTLDVGDHVSQNQVVAQVDVPTPVGETAAGTPREQFTNTADTMVDVRSPVDGVVVARNANPGDVIPAGQSILTIVDPSHLWVVANIEETSIRRVRPGQRVLVHVDDLNADVTGEVTAIVQASAQSFSPLPRQNVSGSFTKVTQWSISQIQATFGQTAMPGWRATRGWRRRRPRPQTTGWRWAFQEAVASATARQTSGQVSPRRPLSARARKVFHQGSIRSRQAAYFGWNTSCQRGWARLTSSTSVARWASRLSRMA